MNALVLNIPHHRKIIRKFSCSYYANGFMYPCVELVRVATMLRRSGLFEEVHYLDAIAENINARKCVDFIEGFRPDFIITLLSVDFINDETAFLKKLKKERSPCIIGIGYVPAIYRHAFGQILDIILGNNFEQAISLALREVKNSPTLKWTDALKLHENTLMPFDADAVALPDYSLINLKHYAEFHTHGRTGFLYFAFGCSFRCVFCIRTYNLSKTHSRNPDYIIDELILLHKMGVKNIRILDDNCTADTELLSLISEALGKHNVTFNFYGLTRFDLINEKTIVVLKKLKFKRLYLGLESIEQAHQTAYMKNLNVTDGSIERKIDLLHKAGIECALFFMIDPVTNSTAEYKKIIRFLRGKHISYANLSFLTPYPGTPLAEMYKDHIEHSPEIYNPRFKNIKPSVIHTTTLKFMFNFYFLSIRHVFLSLIRLFKYPRQTAEVIVNIVKYFLVTRRSNREDFF